MTSRANANFSVEVKAVAEVKHDSAVGHGKSPVKIEKSYPPLDSKHEILHIEIEMSVKSDIITVHPFEQFYSLFFWRSEIIIHEIYLSVDSA